MFENLNKKKITLFLLSFIGTTICAVLIAEPKNTSDFFEVLGCTSLFISFIGSFLIIEFPSREYLFTLIGYTVILLIIGVIGFKMTATKNIESVSNTYYNTGE